MKTKTWKLLLIGILLLALALCCVACTGKPGADGKDGVDSAMGPQGPQGEKGETGAAGVAGPQGPTGPAGEKGDDGVTPLIRINPDSNEWEVSTDNGSTWTTTNVQATGSVGLTGPQGASIEKVEFDAQGRLIITLTDDTVLDPIELPQKEEHQHTFGDWITLCEATCENKGAKIRICACGASEAQEIPVAPHQAVVYHSAAAATCAENGNIEYWECTACGKYFSNAEATAAIEDKTSVVIGATGDHTYTAQVRETDYLASAADCQGPAVYYYKCTTCNGHGEETYTAGTKMAHTMNAEHICTMCSGAYIYFGEYPQTLKAVDVTITETTDSRGYFLGSDGAYYAKVTAYPYNISYTFSDGSTVVGGTVYYFKVEPILWRILSQSDDTALILCDSIIANKAYQSDYIKIDGKYYTTANGAPEGTYANNYQYSEIRAWLNDQFYNTAFTELERELILTTTVDNSVASTGYNPNQYVCENTEDKVFLLSYAEATNSAYGFLTDGYNYDTARKMQPNDYSCATGAWISLRADYYGNGYWWLRSPVVYYSNFARYVVEDGWLNSNGVSLSNSGVAPALQIRLQ